MYYGSVAGAGGVRTDLTVGTSGTGNLTVNGNVSATNANLGNLTTSNYFAGTLTTGAQPNITSTGTLTSLTVSGNLTSGNANLGNLVTSSITTGGTGGNITNANYINANYFTGTLVTGAQPNITSLGSLTDLNVSGNGIIGGNLTVSGTTTYINVTNLAVSDPVIQLQIGRAHV